MLKNTKVLNGLYFLLGHSEEFSLFLATGCFDETLYSKCPWSGNKMTKKSLVSINQFVCHVLFSGETISFKIQPKNLVHNLKFFKVFDTAN